MPMGMVPLDACIYTIIAVLGVAYPILLQVISRLDDKYSSLRAVGLFEEEPARKWFEGFLLNSILAVGIWYVKIPSPLSPATAPLWLVKGVASSALMLVYATTAGLLGCFFWLTRKTLTYYNAQKLSSYLQTRYEANRERIRYFEVLADIFLAAVVARNSPLALQIGDFISAQFARERSREGKVISYPTAYYQLTYRTTEELALLGNRKHKNLAQQSAGGGWLLGGHQHHLISEDTYAALWHNLRIALEYGQDDMVYEYWRTAHQYMEYALRPIAREYEQEEFFLRVANEQAITFRRQERARFLELHHVLGALLLYSGKRDLLRRLFDYTTSQPPRYPLLPASMTEVFTLFVHYYHYADRSLPLDIRYSFPNEAGLASEALITKWLFSYLSVLLLRQYTLRKYLLVDNPLGYPVPPEGQPAKKSWLSALDSFQRSLEQVLQDTELLQRLRLDFITRDWCRQQGVAYPLDYLANVKHQLLAAYQQGAAEVGLSPEKIQQFYTDSGSMVEQAAQAALTLAAPDGARAFATPQYLRGNGQLLDKDAFAAEPELAHLNFSSILGSGIAFALKHNVALLFARNQAVSYRVRPDEVFAALDRLALSQEHVLINLGLDLSALATSAHVADWQPGHYRASQVIDFQADRLSDSLFIIKRAELPAMQFLPPDAAVAEKYGLTQISPHLNLFGSVLDVNGISPAVAAEIERGDFGDYTEEKLKTQALAMLWLLLEFKWQQGAKLVWLTASYEEQENGEDLNRITPF